MYRSCQNITHIKKNINKDTSLLALVFSSRKIHTLILREGYKLTTYGFSDF